MNAITKSIGHNPVEESAKTLGAFYTDVQVADFLVWWAIQSAHDTVMDPSFGRGVFLRSACKRLVRLGGHPGAQVSGVEVDPQVYNLILDKLSDEFGLGKENLWQSDFFDLEPLPVFHVDAVVGNPPFIRYQRFIGDTRTKAINRAADQGVRLTELASSWAPFVVHSSAFLKRGGRLAMVLPMEIGHAGYAFPVFQYLYRSFSKITFLTFQKKLFPNLNEDTLLLLAENKGSPPSKFLIRDLAHSGLLSEIEDRGRLLGGRGINGGPLIQGTERIVHYLIPKKARELYWELRKLPQTKQLGQIADVGIGYVTGANDFFHLSPKDAAAWEIPKRFLKPAVRRGRALSGLVFTRQDWRIASEIGEAGYLLFIQQKTDLPESVFRYLKHGEKQGIQRTYKCRTRSPWFSVPHVRQPDAFLTYMSGEIPRLVTNRAGAVAPNSLHVIRMHPYATLKSDALAALWQTSLTQLSVEIEGHPLGGGMLKMEPTEAEKVIIATGGCSNGDLLDLSKELDALARRGEMETCHQLADAFILQKKLGLGKSDCDLLSKAAKKLRDRRYSRSCAK
jgi:adenine-specific DNA-methyltransferase